MVDLAAVLLVASVLLVFALVLLTIALMRMRGMTHRLQSALEDESGARDRAALLLAMASAVNSSLGLEEVLNVALRHAGRIMGAVAGANAIKISGRSANPLCPPRSNSVNNPGRNNLRPSSARRNSRRGMRSRRLRRSRSRRRSRRRSLLL